MSRGEDFGQIAPHPPQGPGAPGGAGALSPSAMTLQQATRVLAAVGARGARSWMAISASWCGGPPPSMWSVLSRRFGIRHARCSVTP